MSLLPEAPYAPKNLPVQAAALARQHATLLSGLPPVLAASLLTQVRVYDWMFPPERRELEGQLLLLSESPTAETRSIVESFRMLPLPAASGRDAWTAPESFLQTFTANLWHTHATEQFRKCGEAYGEILTQVRERISAPTDRLAVVLVGQGTHRSNAPLFARLRAHGTYFPHVDDSSAVHEAALLLQERASAAQAPYQHWLIDGATGAEKISASHVAIAYGELESVRLSLAQSVRAEMSRGSLGPEQVRSHMMAMQPEDLRGFPSHYDASTRHFATRVLCDGSGTQSLSTSFVQWASREALRRAQPATMIVRFAPRARHVDFLEATTTAQEQDAEGALVDADMGAYYIWLNLQRLQDKGKKSFLAIAENGQGAIAIGSGMSAGSTANSPASLSKIVRWMNG